MSCRPCCKSSCSTSAGMLRKARQMKAGASGDCNTIYGTLVGNLCAGVIKSEMQLINSFTEPFEVSVCNVVTRIEGSTTITTALGGSLPPGIDGQLKYINFYVPTGTLSSTYTADIGVPSILRPSGIGMGHIIMEVPGAGGERFSTVQLYSQDGTWYPLLTQNAYVIDA